LSRLFPFLHFPLPAVTLKRKRPPSRYAASLPSRLRGHLRPRRRRRQQRRCRGRLLPLPMFSLAQSPYLHIILFSACDDIYTVSLFISSPVIHTAHAYHLRTSSTLLSVPGCPGAKKTEFLTSVLDALSTDMVHAVTDPASAGRYGPRHRDRAIPPGVLM